MTVSASSNVSSRIEPGSARGRLPALHPGPRPPRPRLAALGRLVLGPLKVLLVLAAGTGLGLAATALALERRYDPAALAKGPWVTWPKSGTPDIDPYARAILARLGAVPLAAAEGLVFAAFKDDTGAPLSVRCVYRITGPFPPARSWTLAAMTPAGGTMDNAAGRSGFASTEVLRREDGGFDIVAAPSARPGNWLPLSGTGRFVLMARLYETPLSSVAGEIVKAAFPAVTRLGCAP